MIIHLPTDQVNEVNLMDLTSCPHILRDMGATNDVLLSFDITRSVKVCRVGSYHVILSERAKLIGSALDQVPADVRPEVNPQILEWYDTTFEEGVFLLACFGGNEEIDAEPFGVWYEPWYERTLSVPCIDAHDGSPPKLGEMVDRDHRIYVGDTS
jgi:hypothetical protein